MSDRDPVPGFSGLPAEEAELVERFRRGGQGHVFRWWDALDGAERAALLGQLRDADPGLPEKALRLLREPEGLAPGARLSPPDVVPVPVAPAELAGRSRALEAGEEALRAGRVGAFLAAGGQGSRLGFEGPKGTFPIGPVTPRSLFQVFAEGLWAGQRRFGAPIPLAVMTSPENDEATREFFRRHGFFGLAEEGVRFFPQRMLPAFSREGKFLLESKGRLFMNPDGHGGALRVLVRGGALEWFEGKGVDTLYYFQVDNPLLPVPDAAFLGCHLLARSEFTTKVVPKTGPDEKMGVLAEVDGRSRVVEYIHLSPERARERDADGRLVLREGNMAVHAIDLGFVRRAFGGGRELPFHLALKPAAVLDEAGRVAEPAEANACKLETFVFDAIPLAKRTLAVEAVREEEFAPVKASEGADTPGNARRRMTEKAARWLEEAGAAVPRGPGGDSLFPIEISPLTALSPEDLRRRLPPGFRVEKPTVL